MKFAVFDHVDRSDLPLARQFDERLRYVGAADVAGFGTLFAREIMPKFAA